MDIMTISPFYGMFNQYSRHRLAGPLFYFIKDVFANCCIMASEKEIDHFCVYFTGINYHCWQFHLRMYVKLKGKEL